MNEHLARLCREIPEGADAALIESDVNRRYYTGFPSSAGVLVAMRDAAVFLIDFRYIEAARAAADGYDVALLTKRVPQLSQIFKMHNVKRVAVEASRTTVAAYSLLQKQFPGIEWRSVPIRCKPSYPEWVDLWHLNLRMRNIFLDIPLIRQILDH